MAKQKLKQNPIAEALEKHLNLDSLVFYVEMHVFGQTYSIPRGWRVISAKIVSDCRIRLAFSLYSVKTMQSARELFGLPAQVDGEISDWYIEHSSKGFTVVQWPANDSDHEIIKVPVL